MAMVATLMGKGLAVLAEHCSLRPLARPNCTGPKSGGPNSGDPNSGGLSNAGQCNWPQQREQKHGAPMIADD